MISNVIKQPVSLVKLAHSLINEKIKSGDIVIDATVGNGRDTQFLLELVKPNGKVFAFDIQEPAIDSARKNLQGQSSVEYLTFIHASHANMLENIPSSCHGKINAVMFNLGYLPGGDKRIITHAESTLPALSSACKLLSIGGIITILAYLGHEGGEIETAQVNNWCLTLDPEHFKARLFESQVANPAAPKLFVVSKISYDISHFLIRQPNKETHA